MGTSHEFCICRAAYQNARERGAPVVNLVDLGGQFAAETADGKVLVESLTGCCKWAMKFEVAQRWLATNDMDEHWHRIDSVVYASPLDESERPSGPGRVALIHTKFRVVKKTPKGVWLEVGFSGKRFVLAESKRQYASPTFEQAKDKFRRRKGRQRSILRTQIAQIDSALDQLDHLKEQT